MSSNFLSCIAGVRDFAFTALLYTGARPTASNSASSKDNSPGLGSLLGSDVDVKGKDSDFGEIKKALMAGMGIDAVDIVSCFVVFWGGKCSG